MGSGKFTALNGIRPHFGKGEFAGIIGPSGSGKTTLLNIIGSLDSPSEGKAIVMGLSVGELGAKEAAFCANRSLDLSFKAITCFMCIRFSKMLSFLCSCWY